MQSRFYRLPAAVRALITGVLSAAAIFGVMSLYAVSDPWEASVTSLIARIVVSAIAGLLAGVIGVVWGDRRMRRVFGSTEQALEYSHALRTGDLPSEIETAAWLGWLAASRQSNKWAPFTVGLFTALAVMQSIDHAWRLAALMALFAVWQAAAALVLRRRIARLTAAVHRQEQSLGLP